MLLYFNMGLWTQKEIKEYKPLINLFLSDIYYQAKLPRTNPESRAQYLAETILSLTMTDHEVLMSQPSRAAGLNLLEQMVLAGKDDGTINIPTETTASLI